MRLELPLPVSPATGVPAASKGPRGTWQLIELATEDPGEPGQPAQPAQPAQSDQSDQPGQPSAPPEPGEPSEPGARYFERHDLQDPDAARCLLIISPLLPLPRSLPVLLQEALTSEPDFRPDWKWPVLTPRVGPWELVVQMCVGTSLATGYTTGRLYIALDAGFGAYLIVCIDRDPQKLAERQKELLALLAGARLHRDRVPHNENENEDPEAAADLATSSTDIVPPQQPPLEIYLRETLFSYLTD